LRSRRPWQEAAAQWDGIWRLHTSVCKANDAEQRLTLACGAGRYPQFCYDKQDVADRNEAVVVDIKER